MPDDEHLSYTVDLWSEDELSIERDPARTAELSVGRMAFDVAAVSYPSRMITLRGPSICEVDSAEPRNGLRPERLIQHRVPLRVQ